MADPKQDLLTLQHSPDFTLEGMNEANIDLELPPSATTGASVYGTVTDGTDPIADATVKLFDSKGLPYQHTMTDATGAFSMSGIPAGSYSLAAAKTGYRLSDAKGVTLAANTALQADLVCTPDATLALGAIAGVLTTVNTAGATVPLAGAKMILKNSAGIVVASTYTADDGEFAFYDLADDIYTLTSLANGYLSADEMIAAVQNGSIVNLTMQAAMDQRTYNGTVSGIIRDTAGQVVSGCFVGLYRRETVGGAARETLVAITKTNAAGKYLFGNVTGGKYMVKAKLNQ